MAVQVCSHKRSVKIFAHLNMAVISLSILDANCSVKSKKSCFLEADWLTILLTLRNYVPKIGISHQNWPASLNMINVAYGNQFLLPYLTSLKTNYHVHVRTSWNIAEANVSKRILAIRVTCKTELHSTVPWWEFHLSNAAVFACRALVTFTVQLPHCSRRAYVQPQKKFLLRPSCLCGDWWDHKLHSTHLSTHWNCIMFARKISLDEMTYTSLSMDYFLSKKMVAFKEFNNSVILGVIVDVRTG